MQQATELLAGAFTRRTWSERGRLEKCYFLSFLFAKLSLRVLFLELWSEFIVYNIGTQAEVCVEVLNCTRTCCALNNNPGCNDDFSFYVTLLMADVDTLE